MTGACSAASPDASFQQFWRPFRQAILDNDKQRVASVTSFPFEVRGPDDSDPLQLLNRPQFLDLFERLVVQPVYVVVGGQIVPKTMRQLIEETRSVSPADQVDHGFVHFHQFEFSKRDDRWLFTRAYLEE
jgi:hypothetical protein